MRDSSAVDQLRDAVPRRTPRAARRHHAGAQLVDHLFGELALGRRARDVPSRERQLAGLAAIVVAAGAVLLDQLRLRGRRHHRRMRDRGDDRRGGFRKWRLLCSEGPFDAANFEREVGVAQGKYAKRARQRGGEEGTVHWREV